MPTSKRTTRLERRGTRGGHLQVHAHVQLKGEIECFEATRHDHERRNMNKYMQIIGALATTFLNLQPTRADRETHTQQRRTSSSSLETLAALFSGAACLWKTLREVDRRERDE